MIDTLKQAVVDHMRSVYDAAGHYAVVMGKWKSEDDDASVILTRPQHMDSSVTTRQHDHTVTSVICHLCHDSVISLRELIRIKFNIHNVVLLILVCNLPPRSTQLSTLCVMVK